MKDDSRLIQRLPGAGQGSVKSYSVGFLLSLALTFAAYLLVEKQMLTGSMILCLVVALGAVQVVVQLLFFLHVSSESKPRWNSLVLGLMVLILVILFIGTLWIMYNLDFRTMPPMDMDAYMMRQGGM